MELIQVGREVAEHGRRDALALADEAEKDVLRAHVVVLQADRLFAGQREYLPDSISEVVVHAELSASGLGSEGEDVALPSAERRSRTNEAR